MSENSSSKFSYFLVGLGLGALLGILFAPKSGEETREYLLDKANEGRDYAQRKARELRERRKRQRVIAFPERRFGERRGRRKFVA